MPTEATDPIDDYLSGHLSREAHAAFEQRLTQDPSLREEVALQRRIDAAAAQRQDDDRYRELIRRAEAKYGASRGGAPPRSFPKWWLAVAAAIVLVIAMVLFQPWRESPRQLADRYGGLNQPADYLPPAYRQIRNSTEVDQPGIDPADPVRYARTLLLIDTLPEVALRAYRQIPDARLNDSLRFEIALLYLADRRPAAALELLDRLGDDFADDRLWYAALAYLQQGERQTARGQIDTLLRLEAFTPYRREAQQLREDLGGGTD